MYYSISGTIRGSIQCSTRHSSHGLTLFEVLIALAIVAILVTVGIPTLSGTVSNARRTAAVNDLVASVQLARTTAIRRNTQLVICPDDGQQACSDTGDWRPGWLVFVNVDFDRPPRLDENDIVVHRHGPVERVSIDSNRQFFAFHRIGLRSTNGTLTICDDRGPDQARAVIISYTGRPRVASQRSDGSPLECL